jgi:uncharacterized Zn finger protein (UPF0148 family)
MSAVACPNCRTPAPPGAIFCDNCGYDLRTVSPSAQQPVPPTFLVPQGEAGEIICPNCQHNNIAGSAFCENCGTQLSQVKPQAQAPAPAQAAAQKPYQPPMQPAAPLATPAQAAQPPAAPAGFVTGRLVIQESNISLSIPGGKQTVIIGREDPVSGVFPDIDLDPHGGHEAGVGRRHAQLVAQGGQVYIEDLDSVNGTIVNKQKITPHQPYLLRSGDEFRLGKMALVYYTG